MPLQPRRLGWGSLLALTTVVIFIVYAGLTPWALHIGGQSTPGEQWDGFGAVEASNGGRYVLYTHLQAGLLGSGRNSSYGSSGHGRTDNLHGTAELCTASRTTHSFKLTGVVDAWWTTDGAPTAISLTGGVPAKLQAGWVVALRGSWDGPSLELSSTDNSFTKAFTPRGEIRRVTSTADAGTAHVTLHYGSHDEFAAACRGLPGG